MPLHRVSVSLPVIDFVEKFSCKVQIPKVFLIIILTSNSPQFFLGRKNLEVGMVTYTFAYFILLSFFLWGKIKNGLYLVYPVVIDCCEIGRYLLSSTSYKSDIPKG